MILNGFSEQQIKYQAGRAKGSSRMLDIYGNFMGADMVGSIFEKQGLKSRDENSKQVTLTKCPRCDERLGIEDDFGEKAFLKMMENPKIMAMFKEMVNK